MPIGAVDFAQVLGCSGEPSRKENMRVGDCNFIGRITRVEYQRGSGSIVLHGEPGETPIYLQPTDAGGRVGFQACANFAIDLCVALRKPPLGEQGDGTFRISKSA